MKVSEVESIFNQMPSSDRLHLLCKLLHGSITYELNFLSIVLQSYLKERLKSVSEIHEDVNTPSYYTTKFTDTTKIASKEPLETLSACLSLLHHDNQQVGDIIYKLLDQPDILNMAEEIEDLQVFENLRLVYIMGVYHPSMCFHKRHRLLTVYLHQLDEIHNSKIAEKNAREAEERELAFDQNRPIRPSDTAHITKCQLIGFFKRQSDRRYAYVIEVEWSDGANCSVQRTYGDFFGFQNKLLDLFPEESGQKSKKSRLIPFLPGRRLLSGKSNRELAEKRLPDLCNYTKELFLLPKHISSCKHVQDFFRPLLSDSNDISSFHKLITLSEIKESSSSKSRHPSAPAGVTLSTTSSPKSRSGFLNSLTSSRNSHTLPPGKSPEPQRDMKVNKHATMPNQSAFVPISSTTPSSSTEKLHSSSQTSLGSNDRLQVAPPTTTACHVVTPPTSRKNVSPAFAISSSNSLASSSWSNVHTVVNGDKEPQDEDVPAASSSNIKVFQGGHHNSPDTITTSPSIQTTTASSTTVTVTTNQTSSWAECSPPATTDTSFYFSAHNSPNDSTTAAAPSSNISTFRPIQSTPTKRTHKITLSPSLSQLQQYGGSSSQPTYNYPVSYTPTRFESPSPSPKQQQTNVMGGGRWQSSYGPLCTTPTNQTPTESDQLRKWLKVHRLHKYQNLFQDLTFDEISELSVEQLKNMGMTQGAAKKLQQKMEELKQTNIHSFCDIPQTSLTRKPSTSSLPAALLLQDRQGGGITPSTSIDQLSLNGSICSLDVIGGGSQPNEGEVTPHNDHVISKIDEAIVEAGPVNGRNGNKGGGSRKLPTNVVRSKSSQGAVYGNGGPIQNPSPRSMDNTPSHSPLRVQRSLSPHHYHRHSSHVVDKDQFNGSSPNRSSLPTPQQVFTTPPQFHRKDVHSLPTAIGSGDHHRPKIPPALLPSNRLPNWPIAAASVLHGGPNVVPHSAPIICGRVPQSPAGTILPPSAVYPQAINGIIQQTTPPPPTAASINHLGQITYHQRIPSYPVNAHHSGLGGAKNSPSCYNCGMVGHFGSSCPNNISEEYKTKSSPLSSTPPISSHSVPASKETVHK